DIDLALNVRRGERNEDGRRTEPAVVLRDLILEDQVIPERVPGQFGDDSVVLMKVVLVVRENSIWPDRRLEFLEEILYRNELGGKIADAKILDHDGGVHAVAKHQL